MEDISMADKSFIQMKLDKDNALNELKQVVPGLRALQYYHDNPDSSFANTLDLLAEDFVPFYAAHKYGAEPEDYIKEAFIIGMTPAKAQQMKQYIAKHPNDKYVNNYNNVFRMGDDGFGMTPASDQYYRPDFPGGKGYQEYKDVNQLLDDIDKSLNVPQTPYTRANDALMDAEFRQGAISQYAERRRGLVEDYNNWEIAPEEYKESYKETYGSKDKLLARINELDANIKKLKAEDKLFQIENEFNNGPEIPAIDENRSSYGNDYDKLIQQLNDNYFFNQTSNFDIPYKPVRWSDID